VTRRRAFRASFPAKACRIGRVYRLGQLRRPADGTSQAALAALDDFPDASDADATTGAPQAIARNDKSNGRRPRA